MKVLIIDDSSDKISALRVELLNCWPNASVSTAHSFQRALAVLADETPDLVLLDMTFPTIEHADGTLGGRNRLFGGRELLAEIEFAGIQTTVIICTQFDTFPGPEGPISLEDLLLDLKHEFPQTFFGGVYFSHGDPGWQGKLHNMLVKIAMNK